MTTHNKSSRTVYELVWREFNLKWIYKRALFWDISDKDFWQKNTFYFPPNLYNPHSPINNRFFEEGFPLPEQGGIPLQQSAGKTQIRIFMDDLFLCPQCGRFDYDSDFITMSSERLVNMEDGLRLDTIKERKHKKEFEFRRCKDRQRCIRNVNEITRDPQQKWNTQERDTSIREAALSSQKASSEAWVYLVSHKDHVKIGIAVNVRSRLSTLQTSSPFKLRLLKSWKCINAAKNEKRLHNKFAKFRTSGEWFRLPDDKLQMLIAVDDLDLFLSNKNRKT